MRLAYNTNGLAHHRLEEAFEVLAELGYRGVAVTPDVGPLDPCRLDGGVVRNLRGVARDLDLTLAVETGARYMLDPRRKHFPGLLDGTAAQRERRLDLLARHIDLAVELGAALVSVWAGAAPDGRVGDPREGAEEATDPELERLWERLVEGIARTLERARHSGVQLAFEPEPGMFIERPAGYLELCKRLGAAGDELGLCLDVGHLLVTGDRPEAQVVRELAPYLTHVHLDDAVSGRHEHLPFGRGELDLRGVMTALVETGYRGMAAVELSRDSHRGPEAAREAMLALRAAWPVSG